VAGEHRALFAGSEACHLNSPGVFSFPLVAHYRKLFTAAVSAGHSTPGQMPKHTRSTVSAPSPNLLANKLALRSDVIAPGAGA
jgi:hypothetical protein